VDTSLVEIKNHSINSSVLETERDYWVSLPSGYDSSITYPVIYVLDAKWRFSITNALEKELSDNGKIPPHIVVGIISPNRRLDMTFSASRVRHTGELDTTTYNPQNSGNGLKFLSFIEDELLEEVNQKYSTSGFNVLIGHSLGGYFCSYILPIQKSFKSLQIYDPSIWYSDGEAIEHIDNNLSQETGCIIFVSSSANIKKQFANHHKKIKKLNHSLNRYPAIRSEYKNYKDEHHNSMYLHSFLDGMSMLYEGYEINSFGYQTNITVSKIDDHFKKFSKIVQFEFTPPIDLYLTAGRIIFSQRKYKDCIEALEIYLDKNPNNPFALELIGDAYFYEGKKKQSLKHYSKAYELQTENIRLKNKIEKINN
jgi:predicted alpha/beta superfamily hydrolase